MMSPKRTKYRKAHKGRIHGLAKGGTSLNFGAYGLKAMAPDRITARQIEAARRAITRAMKRAGRVWIRIFPDVPVSLKPAEVRMGSGKGAPGVLGGPRASRAASCSRSTASTPELAREALTLGAAKLPIKTKFVTRIGDMPDMGKATTARRYPRQDEGSAAGVDLLRPAQGAVQSAFPAGHRPAPKVSSRQRDVRRDIARIKTIHGARSKRSVAEVLERNRDDAEARPDGPGHQRQDGQDRDGPGQSTGDPSALQEVHPPLEEVRGA